MSEQINQPPKDYSAENAHLRQLIINNVVSVQAENDQHAAFFEQMKSDAVEFATTMDQLPGVWTDKATDTVEVKPQTFLSYAQYRYDEYPLWIIRERTRYGGSSLQRERPGYRSEISITDVIVILKTGHLAVANYFRNREDGLNFWPRHTWGADHFVDRKPFDSSNATGRLRTEWISDLEKAARKYARKTK